MEVPSLTGMCLGQLAKAQWKLPSNFNLFYDNNIKWHQVKSWFNEVEKF